MFSTCVIAVRWLINRASPISLSEYPSTSSRSTSISRLVSPAAAAAGLTKREIEVLRLLVEGYSDKEIGEALFISHRTAMTHVLNILNKLGVNSRTAAAAWALRHGVV